MDKIPKNKCKKKKIVATWIFKKSSTFYPQESHLDVQTHTHTVWKLRDGKRYSMLIETEVLYKYI